MTTPNPPAEESSISIVNTLSIMIVVGYMAAMPMWMFFPPSAKPEILAIINQMMGAWGMAFGTVIAFHLGSSRTSKDAQDATRSTLSQMTNTVATAAATEATKATTAAVVAGAAPPVAPTSPTVTPPFTTPPTTEVLDEAKAWSEAVDANTVTAFEAYLLKFPASVHAVEAKARITALKNP